MRQINHAGDFGRDAQAVGVGLGQVGAVGQVVDRHRTCADQTFAVGLACRQGQRRAILDVKGVDRAQMAVECDVQVWVDHFNRDRTQGIHNRKLSQREIGVHAVCTFSTELNPIPSQYTESDRATDPAWNGVRAVKHDRKAFRLCPNVVAKTMPFNLNRLRVVDSNSFPTLVVFLCGIAEMHRGQTCPVECSGRNPIVTCLFGRGQLDGLSIDDR